MTELWTYSADVESSGVDLTGFDVDATDGHIGKIDENSVTAGDAFIVVDTGFWIFGTKRLVPAGVVTHVDDKRRTVSIDMSKEQVEAAPAWDEQFAGDNWKDRYDDYYGPLGT